MPLFARLGAAHGAAAAVRGAKESFCARRRADEQIRSGLHRTPDDHRLASFVIPRGQFVMTRAKRACRAFAMHEQSAFFSVYHVLYQVCSVMRDVVYHVHLELFSAAAENFGNSFAH